MQESTLARSIRRDLSRQLTGAINDATIYPAVRITVLQSLSTLWARLLSLKDALYQDLGLNPEQPLFYFYMKGGNAFDCVINPAGPAVMQQGGGKSDWDTQIVVDPWAPIPIQNHIYAVIEDLILDELRNCAVEIARWNPQITSPDQLRSQQSALLYLYEVTRDDPQTIRQVFDHNRTGLWLNTQRKLVDRSMPNAEFPGMVFNDGIEPFQLFRLGYTWHAEPKDWPAPLLPGQATGPQIERPLLMELIDVTLPRLNTVEAVEVWEDLQSGHMQIDPIGVSLQYQGTTITQTLPLPSLVYHFDEQVLMLSEVAAGVSKSVDKVARRFARLTAIYNAGSPLQQADYQARMAASAGIPVAQLPTRPPVVGTINTLLTNNGAGADLAAAPGTPQYMAVNMMYLIANRQLPYDGEQSQAGRQTMALMIGGLLPPLTISDVGASDDLALYSTIVRNGYISTDPFPGSGIDMAAWLRVRDASKLEDTAHLLRDNLPRWLFNRATQANVPPLTPLNQWITQTFFGKAIRVELREHTTLRQPGTSREQTLVVFCDDRAVACITLTTAIASQAPFVPDPLMPSANLASVVDMTEQHKVAAAAIKDFCIRNALSKQFNMLNRLFPRA
ncbi:MAG: hypothetical protein A2W72_13795 [Burkholderiales bacterium RIFCSPLOWO2_12_67_14]|nr:MAG: hypothetical protein A3I64_12960 [Burkholderiales bacterium RIFCSPLOWO2_02_FULL_67_64]OGB38717.1 MAG: hypothetical protein A2W72_13795 [Burkholderiales bacterium RIFCSPLOWO2_12_67_14]OGB39213.1 MAG: hypothetical protein A3E51_19865 [Burkholderiales bacterium RIFCSPHIGHO2_12_FULL_67_38]OGB76473.1 MAG: hypothetical protein A3G82_22465 [Burkholderiales bacterium RIFCSPLOWO2_12_FULL_67_210]